MWCDNTDEFLTAMLRTGKNLLTRCDGAGASHELLDWLVPQGAVRGRLGQMSGQPRVGAN